jgi:hypothetical protein
MVLRHTFLTIHKKNKRGNPLIFHSIKNKNHQKTLAFHRQSFYYALLEHSIESFMNNFTITE